MNMPMNPIPRNDEDVWQLIDENPFATLLAATQEGPIVSHLPITRSGDKRLFGHLSRANPQWKHFQNSPQAVAIFHGPHTYVTPRWYTEFDVPTWNYAVVHVHGRIRLIEEPRDLMKILRELSERFENGPDAWQFGLPTDLKLKGALGAAIIGFELDIERLEPKFKLGQNRSQADRDSMRRALGESEDQGSRDVMKLMTRLGI